MTVDVVIKDETTRGDVLRELALQLEAETTTVAELIEVRVRAEVRAHHASSASKAGSFAGLVQPEDRGARPRRQIDADQQVAVALRAFERGHVLLLVDDRQRTELDEVVTLSSGSSITFLKLVPLVGG